MDVQFLVSAFGETQYPPSDRPEVAFAGRSNVGKSSLLNVIVNRKGLAKTSATPGRTQSINYFRVGSSLYLVDLPGYGFARVPLKVKQSWQLMVETYLKNRSNLKAVVVIMDIRREPTAGDIDLLMWLKHYEIAAIQVLTKADKLSRQQAAKQATLIKGVLKGICPTEPIVFSAKTRQGRDEVWERINAVCK
ncbi:putative GTP-binding protein EngB [uncultured Desulfobacterium sp.]|uniref:Probable GTP-binding protein EngB n=1 Tax=uncultured Desulfobacterium sp. TaxID=201089 RepID=A0A445MXB9_9BACT|nr:putative GTP-binding protein EngB [uncultured Desulfobacterium sp.]